MDTTTALNLLAVGTIIANAALITTNLFILRRAGRMLRDAQLRSIEALTARDKAEALLAKARAAAARWGNYQRTH